MIDHLTRHFVFKASRVLACGLTAFFASIAEASSFRIDRDTLAFANSTVFAYHAGKIESRKNDTAKDQPRRYTRRCFVMSRTALQFLKFARFDPLGKPLDDKTLAQRIRQVTRKAPWHPALPEQERVVFPGYADLRAVSKAHVATFQENIGLGWPVYTRIGNGRMFYKHDKKYQEQTQANIEATLARGDLFIAYMSDYPHFHINHAVLVYARKPGPAKDGIVRYLVYDPNHVSGPRELKWSPSLRVFNYQKDETFIGGFTRVYQVFGKPLQ